MDERHNSEIGQKVKDLRTKQDMTLKQVADKTNLSVSFLSQVERGKATLGVNAMARVADAFQVDLGFFFTHKDAANKERVVRSYERPYMQVSSEFLQYALSHEIAQKEIQAMITVLLPSAERGEQKNTVFNHPNGEFIFVLEGILTMTIGGYTYTLYPEDCTYVRPNEDHSWSNDTGKLTKLLTVTSVGKKQV